MLTLTEAITIVCAFVQLVIASTDHVTDCPAQEVTGCECPISKHIECSVEYRGELIPLFGKSDIVFEKVC